VQKTIPGALVTLRNSSTSEHAETHTDQSGLYKFTGLAPGSYVICAENDILGSATTAVTLKPGETKTADIEFGSSSSKNTAQYYDEPAFTIAGVSESSGAGVHGSNATTRNADKLARDTASLSSAPSAGSVAATPSSTLPSDAGELKKRIAENDRAELHNQLGRVEERSGQSLEALKEFQHAAEMDPSEANLFDWGTELLVHRAAEPAIEVFSKGNRLYPQSVRMLTALAVAEYARGKYNAAVDRLCQASDINSNDRLPYIFLGKMQNAEVKRSPNALAKLARFAELYPNDPVANLYYAIALWNQPGSSSDAPSVKHVEQLTKTSIMLDPKSAPAYLQLGVVQASQNQYPEAAAALEKATALDPTLEEAHYRLAQVYRRLGNNAQAQAEFDTYQRLSKAGEQDAELQRKNVQQFVYELGKSPTAQPSDAH
jgi:tetratricopeptide (TPR) repeat protein